MGVTKIHRVQLHTLAEYPVVIWAEQNNDTNINFYTRLNVLLWYKFCQANPCHEFYKIPPAFETARGAYICRAAQFVKPTALIFESVSERSVVYRFIFKTDDGYYLCPVRATADSETVTVRVTMPTDEEHCFNFKL
jgi:hypothetical protein